MTTKVWWRAACAVGISAGMLLTGCNGFFVHPSDGSGGTTTGSSTADYAYVVNSNGSVSEFVIGASTLTAVSGSPFVPGSPLSTASSVVVNPTNAFVFVGGSGGVISYSIATTGALSVVSGGTITETANFASMVMSPNGDWLLALDNEYNQIYIFSVNTSTGVLTLSTKYQLSIPYATAAARMIAISPNGGLVAVAFGTEGDQVFTFDEASTSGALSSAPSSSVNPPASGYSDDSVAFDSTSGYLLVGRGITTGGLSSQLLSYTVSATGVLGTDATYPVGADPYGLLVDNTGGYLYSANRGDGTVSGYTLATGALTQLSSSPYKSGGGATALAEDINSKYVLVAAVGSATTPGDDADLTLYAIDALTPGQLDPVATSANGSGASGSVAVATTHPQ